MFDSLRAEDVGTEINFMKISPISIFQMLHGSIGQVILTQIKLFKLRPLTFAQFPESTTSQIVVIHN